MLPLLMMMENSPFRSYLQTLSCRDEKTNNNLRLWCRRGNRFFSTGFLITSLVFTMMVIATATLAQAEPDSLSPELETPTSSSSSSSSSNGGAGGAIISKPSPRRPTSLAIAASSRSRSSVGGGGTQTTSNNNNNNNNNNNSIVITSSHSNHNPVLSKNSKLSSITTNSNSTRSNYNNNNNSTVISNSGNSTTTTKSSQHHRSSKQKTAAAAATTATSATMSTDNGELACFTSLINGVTSSKTGTAHDEGLEYASVTYRYLKQMDAANNSSKKSAVGGKPPTYARSMMCLNENKISVAPDESIVSVPCPQPSSECPTPAAIRSSLRRRHSDLNLSSIANFLRTRFSRHDDTIQPKPGDGNSSGEDAIDEMLKRPFIKRQTSNVDKKLQENSGDCSNVCENGGHSANQHVHRASPAHHSLINNNNNSSGKQEQNHHHQQQQQQQQQQTTMSCPHPNCSNNIGNACNGSASWRRPCFRCKNHLIEAILESDATEV